MKDQSKAGKSARHSHAASAVSECARRAFETQVREARPAVEGDIGQLGSTGSNRPDG
jgi:hypothetical protein